jgi:hypothetical protein
MNTRNQHGIAIVLHFVAAAILGITVIGCFTVLNHPRIAPPDQVTSAGTVIDEANCGGCHTSSDLWSFHHSGLNQQLARFADESPDRESDWNYYYNPYDQYFAHEGWYGGGFYRDWSSYHHRSWWSLGYASRAMVKAVTSDGEGYVGRGARRDGADRQRTRSGAFVDLLPPPATTFISTSGGLPVSYSLPSSAARAAVDSTAVEESRGRTPTRVRSRYSGSQPVTHSPPPPATSASKSSTKVDDDEDDEEEESSKAKSTGRGARRTTNGSRTR